LHSPLPGSRGATNTGQQGQEIRIQRFSIEKVGRDSLAGHGMAVIAFLVVSNDAYQFL
jgi:hypothetical protein